ncbi:MAG: peptidoglycan recognition family protein [Thermosynechococcaceae cyanobacterium]
MSIALISALVTVFLFETLFPKASFNPVVATPSIAPAPLRETIPKPVQPSLFAQELVVLEQLHQQAARVTIDQLTAEDRAYSSATMLAMPVLAADAVTPPQYRININPTNFGDRFSRDVQGHPVHNRLLIVLHETTGTVSGAISAMLTPHVRDEDQFSYHAAIRWDGAIVYLVDPQKRAYGAGDSMFKGSQGPETVKTKKNLDPSVNNFAYHISLETPIDGQENQDPSHSGYTEAQYTSLAWLIAQSRVPSDRVTTHAAVDQSGERQDPRSFDMERLRNTLLLQTDPLMSLHTTPPP